MREIPIRAMKDRHYVMVPLEKIVVLNSRDRDQTQFDDNVRSIRDVGLQKPVLLNKRFLVKSGKYELVCGEGRFIAHQRLEKKEIAADLIDCDRKYAYLMSLVENIARVASGTMWCAREMKRLNDAGADINRIATIAGKSDNYVRHYIGLVEKGEERLIKGVEQGIFPISFAVKVAESDDASLQNILIDAFENNLINSGNIARVRKIIQTRIASRKIAHGGNGKESGRPVIYSVTQLKRDIARVTREKEAFVLEAGHKESRLVYLLDSLDVLRKEDAFMKLANVEGLASWPELKGKYHVQ